MMAAFNGAKQVDTSTRILAKRGLKKVAFQGKQVNPAASGGSTALPASGKQWPRGS
jgi:hypothetical protein